MTEERRKVHRAGQALHRDGASPAGALDLLAAIVDDRTWERLADAKGRSFKGRFREFVEAKSPYGLGYDPDQLPKVLQLRHPHESVPEIAYRMAEMRERVKQLLIEELAPASEHRGRTITERETRARGTKSSATSSDTRDYVVSRLKRDDPDLADRVVRGEIAPDAAAKAKGWRKPRIVITTPEKVAAALRKIMPSEARRALARLLLDEE